MVATRKEANRYRSIINCFAPFRRGTVLRQIQNLSRIFLAAFSPFFIHLTGKGYFTKTRSCDISVRRYLPYGETLNQRGK